MKILVTNDDGINARGIRTLSERLSRDPENAVYVVAPDRERSATGHALTLHRPIRVEEVDMGGSIKAAWSTSGTPSDCVKFAVDALLQEKPDLVISGINNGANLGTEILYSGTVSAAMEGAFLNIPSIAVSLSGEGEKHYAAAGDFISSLVKIVSGAGLSQRTLLNINVPNIAAGQLAGVAITQLSVRTYNDYFERRVDPRGGVYYWLAGEVVEGDEVADTDAWAVNRGLISITPIAFNMTDGQTVNKLKAWLPLGNLIPLPAEGKLPKGVTVPGAGKDLN